MTRRLTFVALSALLGGALLARPLARTGSDAVGETAWPGIQVVASLPAEIEWGIDLALDRNGNIVLAGATRSPAFPTTPDAVDRTCGPEGDAFVIVYSPTGDVRYSTCLGGATTEQAPQVAPAPDGSIWVAVQTSLEPESYGSTDGRVAVWRLTPGIAEYGQVAWLGGPGTLAWLGDVRAGSDGSVWVLGSTRATYVPAVNAWQPTFGGGWTDLLLARYAPGRSEPLLLTYLGGRDWESPGSLAIAPDGDAILSGYTYSPDFPVVNAAQARFGGGQDLVLARVDVSGRWLEYSTYLGGHGYDYPDAMGVDNAGWLYVAGHGNSPDFPATPPDVPRTPERDVFFASIDDSGRVYALTLMPTATERVPATDVGAFAKLVAPRQDGSVFVLGGYRSDNLLRAGGFRTLVDASGAVLRAAELLDIGEGDGSFVGAPVASGGHAYFVKTMWLAGGDVARWLLRTRMGPAEPDRGARGTGREKR